MPRRTDWIFGLTVLASVALETYALAAVVAASFGRAPALIGGPTVASVVVSALNLTALNVIAVTLIILLLHVVSAARKDRDRASSETWLRHIGGEVLAGGASVPSRAPRAALEALLQLQDTLSGEPHAATTELLRKADVLRATAIGSRLTTRFALLDAFETLARARLPEALPRLFPYLGHRDPTVRFAAARACARVADAETTRDLAERLATLRFGPRAWLEVLLLLRSPDAVVDRLLDSADHAARWAAIETAGRRHLLRFAEHVADLIGDADPEIRAAALRALAKLGYPPLGREGLLLAATQDGTDYVRLQAVRVLALVSDAWVAPVLWQRLGDPSFYVRQAAAHALEAVDADLLRQASASHPDRFARSMALQELELAHAA